LKEESLKELAEMPAMGTRYDPLDPRLAGLRRFRVRGFENYLIFYLPIEAGIEVVRILHAAETLSEFLNLNSAST
jgi:toxin ParE1/3/4